MWSAGAGVNGVKDGRMARTSKRAWQRLCLCLCNTSMTMLSLLSLLKEIRLLTLQSRQLWWVVNRSWCVPVHLNAEPLHDFQIRCPSKAAFEHWPKSLKGFDPSHGFVSVFEPCLPRDVSALLRAM